MSEIINLSEKAKDQIQSILSKPENANRGVRISVVGGGCSGFSYKIDFDQIKDKDNVMEFGEFKLFIDPKSAIYLKGTTLDFQDGLKGKGFVFQNPNASNTCGCGESFTI